MQHLSLILLLMTLILIPDPASAYVGPGLGAGTIGVILGVLGSIIVAIFAIVWYPLKRLLKKRKKTKERNSQT